MVTSSCYPLLWVSFSSNPHTWSKCPGLNATILGIKQGGEVLAAPQGSSVTLLSHPFCQGWPGKQDAPSPGVLRTRRGLWCNPWQCHFFPPCRFCPISAFPLHDDSSSPPLFLPFYMAKYTLYACCFGRDHFYKY